MLYPPRVLLSNRQANSSVSVSLPPSGSLASLRPLQVFPDKRSLKLLKSQSINVNWYQYCPEPAVILLSTTVQGNFLQPFAFRVSLSPRV